MSELNHDELACFSALLLQLAEAFSEEEREGGRLASRALRNAELDRFRKRPGIEDPSEVLDLVRSQGGLEKIIDQVICCHPLLSWSCWEGKGLKSEVSKRLFTTELLGPDGNLPHDRVRVGLLVSEPWTDYPVSSHSGEETYLVLSGAAEWIVGDTDYKTHQPGEFVHHPAWTPHGRRTSEDAFLGAWRWSGDIDLSTFSVA